MDAINGNIGLFGVPFDPLPSEEALLIKHKYMEFCAYNNTVQSGYADPYEVFIDDLPHAISKKSKLFGNLSIPTWLQPKPQPKDAVNLTFNDLDNFVESGGCATVANQVKDFLSSEVFPRIPGMIGVDHSSTYGAISALTKSGKEEIGLIVIDSHFDAVPTNLRHGLYDYATENNNIPNFALDSLSQVKKEHPNNSPDEFEKRDTLNPGNFLLHILNQKLIDPRNLVVIGIMDYPPEAFEKLDDHRIKNYLNHFKSLEKMGVRLFPGTSLRENGVRRTLENAFQGLNASKVYISLDIDIGSLSSVYACRFLDRVGLPLNQIEELFKTLFEHFSDGLSLAGFDIMEVDIHKLGFKKDNHIDLTKEIGKMFLESVGKVL